MKTDKKSLVPLFTFPPPLLAALFLLAGCHYKALQGMVWAIGVGHRARWRSPMFQTPWHAHTFTHTNAHTHSEQPHVLSLSHARAHALRETHTYTSVYMCTKETQMHTHTRNPQTLNICIYCTYARLDVLHANKHMRTNAQHAHNYRKEHAYEHAHTRAHTHVHTGSRRNTGTHRKSSKVIQCRKLVHTSEQHSTGVVA